MSQTPTCERLPLIVCITEGFQENSDRTANDQNAHTVRASLIWTERRAPFHERRRSIAISARLAEHSCVRMAEVAIKTFSGPHLTAELMNHFDKRFDVVSRHVWHHAMSQIENVAWASFGSIQNGLRALTENGQIGE